MSVVLSGQNNLLNHIFSYNLDTLPHTLMFVGPFGCGKHTLCELMSKNMGLQMILNNDKINLDFITGVNEINVPTLVIIDSDDISIKEESVLLKFIEEPKSNIFNVILTENENYVIDTVRNRCKIFKFEPYNDMFLEQYYMSLNNSIKPDVEQQGYIFKLLNTPGKIIKYKDLNYKNMVNLSNQIFDLINKTTLSNIFNISKKISFKDDGDFPYSQLVNVMHYVALQRVIENRQNSREQYILINELYNNSQNKYLDKQQLFENFLYRLKGIK